MREFPASQNKKGYPMKESEARLLSSHGALKDVVVERSASGARAKSGSAGWLARINGEPLSSARKPVRVFASLDTASEALASLGIRDFRVVSESSEASR